ncbi:MAG TPA: AAA family ATPase, partial [Amaricoccus sp.]|nr:AAA family ATPase [Amaricoccus sp.]
GIIDREAAIGIDVEARRARLAAAFDENTPRLESAESRWEAERALVGQILELRARLRGEGVPLDPPAEPDAEAAPPEAGSAPEPEPEAAAEPAPPAEDGTDREADLAELRRLTAELETAQGESPLILPSVDRNAVAAVVQDWTGIPTGRMLTSQTEKALNLAAILAERVVGQDHAMQMIARRVQTSRAGLGAPEKPVGVFLLCGPSGVGKTETALALAETLYGGEQNLITINMSEFQEAHTVSLLKGAPPGYVGYGKGGVLTEAVRRKPWSVILLDEVEKAHPDVHEIFFQVFDKGMMDDSEGRRIDFKNCLILLTSNVGSEVIMRMTEGGAKRGDIADLDKALRPPLLQTFPAAFLGRVVTIPYYPLSDGMIESIARARLARIARQLMTSHEAELVVDDGVLALIRARCTEVESGGRMIDAILTDTLLPELSRGVLDRSIEGTRLARVTVGADAGGFTYAFE